jgi:hypothetical protein
MPARSCPPAIVVLLACLLAGVAAMACTSPAAAPSPAAPSRGMPSRGTPSRAVPAAVGDPGWLIKIAAEDADGRPPLLGTT